MSHENLNEIDASLIHMLRPIDDPLDGYTIREMVRIIWNYPEGSPIADEAFYNHAKLLERRIGAIRHRILGHIREQIQPDNGDNRPKTPQKPDFIPYALPTERRYYRYFNAANYRQMPYVVQGLRQKAQGMDSNADILEAIFPPP